MEDIKQNVIIEVKEKGVSEATTDFGKLETSITETTTANSKGNAELKKTEEGFKTLKVQLREAIALQQKMSAQYGSTSAEAIKATKAVAGIKDEIGFQKDLVDSYNPDDKFRKLTQTAGIAALALGGVKDGFSALGIESKTLDKIIGSAQAILGVTSAVAGMTDAYEILTASKKAKSAAEVVEIGTTEALVVAEGQATVASQGATIATTLQTAATWALNAAIAVLTSPILVVVAAIALLVGGIGYLTGAFGDFSGEAELAERASKKLSKEIDKQTEAFEKNAKKTQENNDFKLKMRKASGASEEAIYKETKALKEQELQLARNNEAQALYNLKKAIFANQADPNELNAENQKKAQEAFTKSKQNIIDTASELRAIKQDYLVAERQAETDAEKKAEEEREKQRQKQKDARIKAEEDENKRKADAKQKQLDADMESAKKAVQILDELEKSKETPAQKEQREFEEKKAVLEANNLSIIELEKDHLAKMEAIRKEEDAKFKEKEKEKEIEKLDDKAKELDDETLTNEEKRIRLDEETKLVNETLYLTEDEKTARLKEISNQRIDIDNAEKEQKEAIQTAQIDIAERGIQLVAGVFGKSKAIQKGAIIAENAIGIGKQIIANNTANAGALATPQAIATSGASAVPVIALNNISTGIGIASTIAATAKALSAVGGGGASGGGSNQRATPTRNVAQVGFQGSSENQIGTAFAKYQKEQPPIQAFVVSQSVTDQQELDRKKELQNSF